MRDKSLLIGKLLLNNARTLKPFYHMEILKIRPLDWSINSMTSTHNKTLYKFVNVKGDIPARNVQIVVDGVFEVVAEPTKNLVLGRFIELESTTLMILKSQLLRWPVKQPRRLEEISVSQIMNKRTATFVKFNGIIRV